ncbi:MAG TPA: MIP family channel protein [Actinomycetota bacterium]|nr:MIP family channel protein [Actinomycetota bacterium]
MERNLIQRLVAEFVGVFALVFIGIGAGISSQAGGGLVTVALAHGLVIAVMVSAVGHVSGGHFNPAITIGAWVAQKIRLPDAISYLVVQLLGGAAGAAVLRLAIPEIDVVPETARNGVPQIVEVISTGQGVLIEAVLTFFLVWVVFGTAIDPEGSFNKIAGLAIGFTIALDIMMGGPFTGAAMNPARSFGPALVSGTWTNWWVYWVGPIAGGVIAALLYDTVILRPRLVRPADEPMTPPPAEPDELEVGPVPGDEDMTGSPREEA